MAHLWVQQAIRDPVPAGAGTGAWDILALGAAAAVPLPSRSAAAAVLLRSRSADADLWLLLALTPGSIALNGAPLRSGIRVLTDQDEISLGAGRRMFFSTERLAAVQPCTSAHPDLRCGLCRKPIPPQSDAVACPTCNVWYHQTHRLPCWTYGGACTGCGQARELTGSYRWTPEVL